MEPATTAVTAFFGAVREIALLVPQFDERKKSMIEKKHDSLELAEKALNDYAVSFGMGSSTDVLMGLADDVRTKRDSLQNLYVLYASEIRGEKK